MSDNTTLDTGSGGDAIRSKDRAGVKTQVVALDLNPAGSETLMAGAMPVTGTFWQATQPISASALPLPAGAATAANQAAILAALGGTLTVSASGTIAFSNTTIAVTNAGTFAVQVSAALPAGANVIGHVIVDSGALAATQSGTWTVGISAAQTIAVTNAGTFAVQATLGAETTKVIGTVNIAAAQTIGLAAGSAVIGHVIVDSGTITTVTTVSAVTNLAQLGGVAIAMNTGVRAAGVQRVTICTDDVVPASQSGAWTVQPGNTPNTTPWLATETPAASGGASIYSVNSSGAANQDAAAIKGSAGQVYGYSLFNTTASARYVKLYNLASGATSASTPVIRIFLPAGGGANSPVVGGIAFGTGISIRITTGAADNDAGACSANDVLANVWYK